LPKVSSSVSKARIALRSFQALNGFKTDSSNSGSFISESFLILARAIERPDGKYKLKRPPLMQ
jgi:hypothetical protein